MATAAEAPRAAPVRDADIEAPRGEAGRFPRAAVEGYEGALVAFLRSTPGVGRVAVAGSYRRCEVAVDDLDVLVTAAPGSSVLDPLAAYEGVTRVIARGPARLAVELPRGLVIDVRLVDDEAYGAALHGFTGSKAHVLAIRRLGRERGLEISERGVFRGDARVAGDTEESVFASVGLPFIPPELREDRGEIAAAREGRLPRLVGAGDLRGDLHTHTSAADGRCTIREMTEAALELGYEYLAITDRTARAAAARGIGADRLLWQADEIDRLNAELGAITILKGVEVAILEDGRLDLPDEVLGRLDLVVGAAHDAFGLSREAQTARLLRAMDRPHFSILAHPTGRLIQARAPYDVDLDAVMDHARQRGCFLELTGQPDGLGLTEVHAQRARERGVLIAVDSDAHTMADLRNLHIAVGQARRGWLEEPDVINARPLGALRALLRRTM
jgi:DNA polymerase (family 10)